MAPLLAHSKWFADRSHATDWSFATEPGSLLALAAAALGAGVWWLVAQRLPRPEIGVLRFLARLTPFIPRLLAIHLGVALLGLAVRGAYLAPHLPVDALPAGGAVALLEGGLGVWLITGVRLRLPAIGVMLLGPLGLVAAGPVAVLEAIDLLGIALFVCLLPPGRDRWGAVAVDPEALAAPLWLLKACAGLTLIVLAFSEKLANPGVALDVVDRYPALNVFAAAGIEVPPEPFIQIAAGVEVLFGVLIVLGAAPQAAVLVAGVPFNATLWFFGTPELIGHLPVYGVMLALLAYGSDERTAAVVGRLAPPSPQAVRRLLARDWPPLVGPPARREIGAS